MTDWNGLELHEVRQQGPFSLCENRALRFPKALITPILTQPLSPELSPNSTPGEEPCVLALPLHNPPTFNFSLLNLLSSSSLMGAVREQRCPAVCGKVAGVDENKPLFFFASVSSQTAD